MTATENEEAILTCLLTHPAQSAPLVCSELRPDHFLGGNGDIYREILALYSEGQAIDAFGVAGRLRDRGRLDALGGFPRISSLSVGSVLPSALPEHIRVVREKAAQRKAIHLLRSKLDDAEGANCDVSELIASTLSGMECIGMDRVKRKTPSTKELAMQAIARIQNAYEKRGKMAGASTGITDLDKATGGVQPADQWVIAGPAKGGKSALAATFLRSLAMDEGKRCAFFGLEMPSVENVERIIYQYAKVSATNVRNGFLSERDFPAITAAAAKLSNAPIHFRDDIFDLAEMLGTARQLKSGYPDLYAVFIDYTQLISGSTDFKNREQEVAMVSRAWRKFAMQTETATILLSQVNDDGKLRESRALGMDATKICTIELTDEPGVRKLRLIQRNGASGIDVPVAYIGEQFLFADLAEDYQPKQQEQKPKRTKRSQGWQND